MGTYIYHHPTYARNNWRLQNLLINRFNVPKFNFYGGLLIISPIRNSQLQCIIVNLEFNCIRKLSYVKVKGISAYYQDFNAETILLWFDKIKTYLL